MSEQYVYASSAVSAKRSVGRSCDIIVIEDFSMGGKALSFVFRNGTHYASEFSTTILRMKSSVDKILKETSENNCLSPDIIVKPLPLKFYFPLYMATAFGMAVALLFFVLERLLKRCHRKHRWTIPPNR